MQYFNKRTLCDASHSVHHEKQAKHVSLNEQTTCKDQREIDV